MRETEQIELELIHAEKELRDAPKDHVLCTYLQGYIEALNYVLENQHTIRRTSDLVRAVEQCVEEDAA